MLTSALWELNGENKIGASQPEGGAVDDCQGRRTPLTLRRMTDRICQEPQQPVPLSLVQIAHPDIHGFDPEPTPKAWLYG